MAADQVISFEPSTWSQHAEAEICSVAGHTARDIEIFRSRVERGKMDLMDVIARGERVGCLIWSVCHEADGPVMVINALAARPVEGEQLALVVMRRFQAFAKATGCIGVRCWTKRAGLVRVLERAGAVRAWHVMEVSADGQ